MTLLKFFGLVWILLMAISAIGIIFGLFVENKVPENTRLKKWWRKNISAPDPYDNDWKNFEL
jgi:hypothetical protein